MLMYHTSHKQEKGTPLTVVKIISEHVCNGRTYKLLDVKYGELPYLCLRLYNAKGRFIKQFLFEHTVTKWLKDTLGGVE
ncbi:MAG: hypothetical protein M0Q91_05410 [Methanoregula sp.]|jgi:hypothetical protein|nr:hypothetical protein [Methanoregula sp.]